jgi:hypothetical protein
MVHAAWAQRTIAQLSLLGSAEGQQIVNVYHFQATVAGEALMISDSVAQTMATTLATDWLTACKVQWLQNHPAGYSLNQVTAQVLERPGNVDHRLVATITTTGLPSPGTMPNSTPIDDLTTCAVIRWRTPIAGRSHRGRTYIGPVTDAWSSQGRIATPGGESYTFPQRLAQHIADMLAFAGPAGSDTAWNHTIYSRPYNNPHGDYVKRVGGVLTVVSKPDYAGNATNVTSGAYDDILRTQRRRELGVGS